MKTLAKCHVAGSGALFVHIVMIPGGKGPGHVKVTI